MVCAEAAAELYSLLRRSEVRCWVMGGWGVDALLGRQTRDHHDLDVLALVDDLPNLRRVFDGHGFVISHVWEKENRWLEVGDEPMPSAFVAADVRGTARTQLGMHRGYELPEHHARDVDLLRRLQ